MEYQLSIGDRMTVYRKRSRITKTELAKRAGVSVSTIAKYENDEVESPDFDILTNIALGLDVSVNRLLTGLETPENKWG